jgi:RNA polymerase sigma factor (sigma-70 family)
MLGSAKRPPDSQDRDVLGDHFLERDRTVPEVSTPLELATLLDQHGAALVLYARGFCDCPEDVVQDALLELISQRQRPTRLVAWLYRVVRNGAIGAARGARRRMRRETAVASPEAWFENVEGPLDAQEAAAALATLPLELREVVVARIWGSLTFAEIAELVSTSLSTAQRRYEQGIRQVQTRLEKSCKTPRRTTPS